MRKIAALGALAALALGCGSAVGGTATGLRGFVKRGPTMPVCRVGVPCDEPAPGVKLKFSRSGKVVATAITNQRGWYRVTLRAGRYSVSTNVKAPSVGPQPRAVTVEAGRMKRRDFFIDTGIR
jgi:hypothetical protein